MIGLSGFARARTALDHPSFDTQRPEALLKSDPALLYYFTERIVESGGAVPEDFRADPRVQWPEQTDIPAEFTVGQEFLVAWGYALFGGDLPLHVFAVWLMAFVASLAAAGVYGAVAWRTKSHAWAFVAAACYCIITANYRTIGFILIREDLSLPLFALHLALLARSVERPSARAFLLAGLFAGAACATWHAMGFFLAIEVACLHLWFLRGGSSPFEVPGAPAVLIGPVLAAVLVPALRTSGFLMGLPMLLTFALFAVGTLRARGKLKAPWAGALGAACSFAILAGLAALLAPERGGYAHVFEMLLAKLRLGGVKPIDPNAISFDARLLWQGPFETLPLADLVQWLGWPACVVGVLTLCVALAQWRELSGFAAFWLLFLVASIPVAWLIGRMVVLVALLLPAAVSCLPKRALGRGPLAAFAALVLLGWGKLPLSDWTLPWYERPNRESWLELVDWVRENVPQDEPIAADFVTSTALLASCGNPILLQPKYETERSRRRAEDVLGLLLDAPAQEVTDGLRERYGCRTIVWNRWLGAELQWTLGRGDANGLDRLAVSEGGAFRRTEVGPPVPASSFGPGLPPAFLVFRGE